MIGFEVSVSVSTGARCTDVYGGHNGGTGERASQPMIRLLVSESAAGDADKLTGQLALNSDIHVVGISRDGLETAQLIAQLRPDVALIHSSMPAMSGYEACRLSSLVSPGTSCIIMATNGQPEAEVRAQAMLVGARGVLPPSADSSTLINLIRQLAEMAPSRDDNMVRLVTDPSRMPVTISVTGAKGGIGKTTVATNLALSLQQRCPGEVVLVDFVGHYGDINLLLNMPDTGGILELTDHDEIDQALLHSRITTHGSGLSVLSGVSGPESMTAVGRVSPAWVAGLLGSLRRDFRIIVVDVAAILHPLSKYIFTRSSFIVIVSVLAELSTVRDTGGLIRGLLDAKIPPERLKLVVNRHDRRDQFTPADLERVAEHPISAFIPRDEGTVLKALNSGDPFVISKPKTPVAGAVVKLGRQLIPDPAPTSQPAHTKDETSSVAEQSKGAITHEQ